jgi:hypothetical protein
MAYRHPLYKASYPASLMGILSYHGQPALSGHLLYHGSFSCLLQLSPLFCLTAATQTMLRYSLHRYVTPVLPGGTACPSVGQPNALTNPRFWRLHLPSHSTAARTQPHKGKSSVWMLRRVEQDFTATSSPPPPPGSLSLRAHEGQQRTELEVENA